MTTYEQPKDWIERHLVEDPGGLLACEPSRLDTLNEELRLARQANEAQHQQLADQRTRSRMQRRRLLRADCRMEQKLCYAHMRNDRCRQTGLHEAA